jgi:hypothetical protein
LFPTVLQRIDVDIVQAMGWKFERGSVEEKKHFYGK